MPSEQEKKIKIELSPSQKKIETPKCKISSEREKEINLFKSVLLSDYKEEEIDDEFDQHIHDICFQIVQGRWLKKEIFAKNQENSHSQSYKDNIRFIMVNLKNKSNPQLRLKVIRNELTPLQLISCDPRIYLSDEHRKEFEKIKHENLQSYTFIMRALIYTHLNK